MALSLAAVIMPVMFQNFHKSLSRKTGKGKSSTPVNPSQKLTARAPAVSLPVSAVVPANVSEGAPVLSTASAAKPQEPVWYNAKTDRDPTLSPAEQRRAERTHYLQSHPAAPASAGSARAARQAVRPVSIERRIKLTAIVMTPGNTRAIVNDQIMKVGDNVFGARIVRITNTKVFFRYKNKQFTKVMPRE